MGTIILKDKQQRQAEILTRLAAARLTGPEAAQLLGISTRHLRRLAARFGTEGPACLVHGNTGRRPGHATGQASKEKVLALAGEGGPLRDFNVCHLQEILAQHDIAMGRSTLDRLLKEMGLRRSGRKPGARRQRRERKAAEGMLLQIDGSPHDWLEGRGPRMTLVGATDDATGKIPYLCFHPSESQEAYLRMLRAITLEHGLPMSLYHDRHTILRSPKEATVDDELAGRAPMSQVQRVLHELGVGSIAALSPQAKGRIERLWRTLQDRLVKEMRLAGVATPEAANAFLPGFIARFNARFGKEARDPEAAWVAAPADLDLGYYFAVTQTRTLKADHTLSFGGKTLQVLDKANLSGRRVSVHVVPEGDLYVYDGKRRLSHRPLEAQARPQKPPAAAVPGPEPAKAGDPGVGARRRAWLFGQPA